MQKDIEMLIVTLDEIVALLRKHEIDRWADWLNKDARYLRNSDFHGVEHLMSAFGGMGSLNDLVLAEVSADNPEYLVTSPDDALFQSLLNKIHSLGSKLAASSPEKPPAQTLV